MNYPAPIISLAESETQLRAAAKVVQQALAASASAVEVRANLNIKYNKNCRNVMFCGR